MPIELKIIAINQAKGRRSYEIFKKVWVNKILNEWGDRRKELICKRDNKAKRKLWKYTQIANRLTWKE